MSTQEVIEFGHELCSLTEVSVHYIEPNHKNPRGQFRRSNGANVPDAGGNYPPRKSRAPRAFTREEFLAAFDTVTEQPTTPDDTPDVDLDALRAKALADSTANPRPGRQAPGTTRPYIRRASVRTYALARAEGHCEWCGTEYPYCTGAHLDPLFQGGADTIWNVACLCRNCATVSDREPEMATKMLNRLMLIEEATA